jgi:hypothetical protein
MKTVGERLTDLGKIYDERGAAYGKDYHHTGEALAAFYPDGITLRTPREFRAFMIRCFMLAKLMRDANHLVAKGTGHLDSLDDLAVYAQMTRELEEIP